MKEKSRKLISCLRKNSREKLTNISKKTNIPISTLFDLLKELQNTIITKHTSLVNFSKLGYHTSAQIFLKVNKKDKDKLRRYLLYNNSINTIYKINNNWDFVIETVHRNIKDLDNALEKIESKFNIEDKKIYYLVDEIKKEGFVLD